MLRREGEEPIRICGLYKPDSEFGKTKMGRPAESYANYIAGQISKAVKLSNVAIEAAAQRLDQWEKLVTCSYC